MPPHSTSHSQFGSLALSLAALLLTVFPLLRPFFPLDPRAPAETLAVASPVVTSASWVVSHMLCTLAFVLLLYGVLTLSTCLATTPVEPRAFRAMVLSLAGIALILPMLGVATSILPMLGKLSLAGQADLAPALAMIDLGPTLGVLLIGLLLLAVGTIMFAVALWHSAVLPRWAGVRFAIGLTLWFPLFPRVIRILDGFVIGLGGVWLAGSLRHKT